MESLESKLWDRMETGRLGWILSSILVLYYLYVCGSDAVFGPSPKVLHQVGALNAEKIDAGEFWRLSASLIMHGDLLHLSFNILALIALVRIGEAIYGGIRVLGILYISGLSGAFLSWSMGAVRTVGASGAIFGLLAVLCVGAWKFRDEIGGELGDILRKKLIFWGVLNLLLGLVIPNIDNPSHIGGVIGGILLGMLLNHRWEGQTDRIFLGFMALVPLLLSLSTLS